jgi:hypothetical protein
MRFDGNVPKSFVHFWCEGLSCTQNILSHAAHPGTGLDNPEGVRLAQYLPHMSKLHHEKRTESRMRQRRCVKVARGAKGSSAVVVTTSRPIKGNPVELGKGNGALGENALAHFLLWPVGICNHRPTLPGSRPPCQQPDTKTPRA